MTRIGKLRIKIDNRRCLADGVCCEMAPGTFSLNSEGEVQLREGSGEDLTQIIAAAESCRMDAIVVIDEETGEQLVPRKSE